MEVDRGTDRKKGGSIGCPSPIELGVKAFAKSVRNRHRVQIGLPRGGCPQKPAALWRAQPFVAIADIPVSADCTEIEGQLTRPVCAVDQNRNPCRTANRDDVLDRQNESALGSDVIYYCK